MSARKNLKRSLEVEAAGPTDNEVDGILATFKGSSSCPERIQQNDEAWQKFRQRILSRDSDFRSDLLTNFNMALKMELAYMELEEKEAMLLETQQLLQETRQMLQETIQEKDAAIQEKDEAKQNLQSMNIAGLLALKDSSRLKLAPGGTESSHIYTKHKAATFVYAEFGMSPVPTGENDSWADKGLEKAWDSQGSTLLSSWQPGMAFYNEADVQLWVHNSILDAVFICNQAIAKAAPQGATNIPRLAVRREASLLSSNRPDHTVIFEAISGHGILTIEDKKPWNGIEAKAKVLGQCYDYLAAMASLCHPTPFCILTTFKQTWVTWIYEKDTEMAASSDRFNFKKVEDLAFQLTDISGMADQQSTPPPPESYEPTVPVPSDSARGPKKMERIVYLSDTAFEAHELVPVLCNAILCGLRGFHRQSKTLSLSEVKELTGPYLQLNENGYDWSIWKVALSGKPATKLNFLEKTGQTIRRYIRREEPPHFNVIEVLGVGETSRALRAVTEKGDECVIKMYIRKFVDNKEISDADFEQNAKVSVAKEAENFHKIYGMKDKVWTIKLNGFYCVIHPYFEPVPVQDRSVCADSIGGLLKDKFKPHGLGFAPSDMRWRHVGMFDGETYLYDLADLTRLEKDEVDHNHKLHVDVLEGKIEKNDNCSTP